MDLRKEFMPRLAQGERLSDLCAAYGISRKTAQKFKARLRDLGEAGLEDRSRAPRVIPHKMSPEVAAMLVELRREHPTWGPLKLKAILEARHERKFPSHTAIAAALKRAGVAAARAPRRRSPRPHAALMQVATAPNDIFCIDFKGHFRTGDKLYCYPLTITDQFGRCVLGLEGMPAISDDEVRDVCLEVFRKYGLPRVMRSDNGAPFASAGLGGLTRLSAMWLQLAIQLERTRPGTPSDNGAHERMHRTLKAETTRPARANLLQQQEVFEQWRHDFNHVRPHQALGMKTPAQCYVPSTRRLPASLPELEYPTHDDALRVCRSGGIYISGVGSFHVTPALAGQYVGVREERDGRWLITFATVDLGHVSRGSRAIVPCTPNSNLNPDLSPMCLV